MVIDSSVWLAIFLSQGPKDKCIKEIENSEISVPSICFFEVLRKLKSKLSDFDSMQIIAKMAQAKVLELTLETALLAADLSEEYSLPMADSLVLAHARIQKQVLLTLDNDFAGIPDVRILK